MGLVANYEIGLNLEFLEDPTGKLKIEDISEPKWASKFIKSKEKTLNFGFTNSTFWIRFIVINNSDEESWYISQNSANTERIELFKKNKRKWKSLSTGTRKSIKTREIKDKGFLFKIYE